MIEFIEAYALKIGAEQKAALLLNSMNTTRTYRLMYLRYVNHDFILYIMVLFRYSRNTRIVQRKSNVLKRLGVTRANPQQYSE